MSINLAGKWKLWLEQDETETGMPTPSGGTILLPGSLQAAGYGYPVTEHTEWVSSLHNPFWYQREEYSSCEGYSLHEEYLSQREHPCRVSFLSQPARHFIGVAWYERSFVTETEEAWTLRLELARWKTTVYVDGRYVGGDCSLCTAHEIFCGSLKAGEHRIRIRVDNRMQYPYRPDGHGVSDALGATWNGMVGEMLLLTEQELEERKEHRREYARRHPRSIEVKDGRFLVDGFPRYFRGTHFGGDYPLTGYPETEPEWWLARMRTVKEWGFNFIRCHSFCPPEAAFLAADEEGVYLQPECGMWNYFKEGIPMLKVLQRETERILEQFGHHPSFVLFSPTNEPGGPWYQALREWVAFAKETDRRLGYAGRRLYTAQSGWFYDTPPGEIAGTDYIYFHRSGYGPITGGAIRGAAGWRGGNYDTSLAGVKLPVICHEMGQWCAYPDFRVIEKYTGFLRPGNYELFRERAKACGLLPFAEDFLYCSGRNQVRLYKEDIEANLRTAMVYGYEMLDLHDYSGQGTALVGVLDAFWESKGYVKPEEFREFCGETVLLAELSSYVWRNTDTFTASLSISHFGKEALETEDGVLTWKMTEVESGQPVGQGRIRLPYIPAGSCTRAGNVRLPLAGIRKSCHCIFELTCERGASGGGTLRNHWDIYVFARERQTYAGETDRVLYTRDWQAAREGLFRGKTVIFSPCLSDLDYECPPLDSKNVFWNAQMGPCWCRPLGISVQEEHPIFSFFPTEHDGGWQWEDILTHARGFCLDGLPQGFAPVVRAIDDWNRSLPLSLILEGNVGAGRLLLVSADLEGSFKERPAAYSLKQALLRYAEEGNHILADTVAERAITGHLFPVLLNAAVVLGYRFFEHAQTQDEEALLDGNPDRSCCIRQDSFPIEITICLRRETEVYGLLYVPVQRDRMFEGCVREYRVFGKRNGKWEEICKGSLSYGLLSRKIIFPEKIVTTELRFTVLSCYADEQKVCWEEAGEGWQRSVRRPQPMVQLGGLSVLCDGEAPHENTLFWTERRRQMNVARDIEN